MKARFRTRLLCVCLSLWWLVGVSCIGSTRTATSKPVPESAPQEALAIERVVELYEEENLRAQASLEAAVREVKGLQDQWAAASLGIPQESELAGLKSAISARAEQFELEVEYSGAPSEAIGPFLVEIRQPVRMHGHVENAVKLVEALSRMTRLVALDRFEWSSVPFSPVGDSASFDADIVTYRFASHSEAISQDAPEASGAASARSDTDSLEAKLAELKKLAETFWVRAMGADELDEKFFSAQRRASMGLSETLIQAESLALAIASLRERLGRIQVLMEKRDVWMRLFAFFNEKPLDFVGQDSSGSATGYRLLGLEMGTSQVQVSGLALHHESVAALVDELERFSKEGVFLYSIETLEDPGTQPKTVKWALGIPLSQGQ